MVPPAVLAIAWLLPREHQSALRAPLGPMDSRPARFRPCGHDYPPSLASEHPMEGGGRAAQPAEDGLAEVASSAGGTADPSPVGWPSPKPSPRRSAREGSSSSARLMDASASWSRPAP